MIPMDYESVNVAVVAGTNLSRGTLYGPLNEFEFTPIWSSDGFPGKNSEIIEVIAKNGHLYAKTGLPWIQFIRSSRDIYEQNIEAVRSRDDGSVFLRVTRNLARGELLCGWYEDSYARELNVPYLTFENIKGVQDYRCHLCVERFNFPNQLKAHIMYNCPGNRSDRQGIKFQFPSKIFSLARHTINTFSEKTNVERTLVSKGMSMVPALTYNKKQEHSGNWVEPNYHYLTSISCKLSYKIDPNSLSDPCQFGVSLALQPKVGMIHKHRHVDTVKESSPSEVFPHKDGKEVKTDSAVHQAEPLEILHRSFIEFSTKRGHLCVYCGKFYSRKYGLKIHLRTHTGYKPLKCKICSRAFGDPSNLNKHIRLHEGGSTPYRCHHCGKLLVRRRDLMRHLKSRHPREHEPCSDKRRLNASR